MADASTPTTAPTNLIKSADLAKVREVDFVSQFNENLKKLMELLGVTRKIEKQAGTVLKVLKVTGTLVDGTVAEGEDIPLSKYQTTYTPIGEIVLKKWAKATSIEAINDKGYEQAVGATTDKMLKDVAKGIRTDFFTVVATGTGTATGTGLQACIANMWAKIQNKFEDTDASSAIYFINPLDVADYLGTAQITTQTAFGFTFLKDFLGMGTVILNSNVPAGTVYGTVADNLILYYINVQNSDISQAFAFTTDETGYIGIHEDSSYKNLTATDTVISGIQLFPEIIDGVFVGTIAEG